MVYLLFLFDYVFLWVVLPTFHYLLCSCNGWSAVGDLKASDTGQFEKNVPRMNN